MSEVFIEIDQEVFLPCYRHLQNEEGIDIDLIYGGRDSGKSRDEAQRLVKKCLEQDYFRCILVRKTFNTIKDSQWQLIKDVVEEWGLDQFFIFNVSPLTITCLNGNKFLARGFEDPKKIKSIQNPSCAWVEEANELSHDDIVILLTSLRSNSGNTKIDLTFNTDCEGNYEDFHLYKDYFSHTTDLSFTRSKKISVSGKTFDVTWRATHTTYKDNPYCSQQRIATYESLKDKSPYHYTIYALGLWGTRIGGQIFPEWTTTDTFPDIPFGYGMDFGFTNDPTTLIKVGITGEAIYLQEMLYKTGMTTPEITSFLSTVIKAREEIVADSAEPRLIKEIQNAGFNIWESVKGKDSITQGIDIIKRYKIIVVGDSPNLKTELRNYKWANDSQGNVLNYPIDEYNHLIDPTRYRTSFVINRPSMSAAKVTRR